MAKSRPPAPPASAEVVICGAGIAGIAAAYHLAVRNSVRDVLLVDERAPLTLTSDKSMEGYRNWWAGPDGAVLALMNRSIDLLEGLVRESGDRLHMNRRGYLFVTAEPEGRAAMEAQGRLAEAQGAGPLRVHASLAGSDYRPAPPEEWQGQPTGADLLVDPALIRRHFPYLSPRTLAVLHARRCGWFSAQQLGMLLLEQARAAGVRFRSARLEGVELAGGRVQAVHLREPGAAAQRVSTPRLVLAAGPHLKAVAAQAGLELPVFGEAHLKVSFADARGAVPRDAPFLIWNDPQRLEWNETERAELSRDPALRPLLGELPRGPHVRPEGGADSRTVLMLWAYHLQPEAPRYPVPVQPHYAEVTLRGMTAMLPALGAYLEKLPRPYIDGGYYAKTRDNRPLVGPTAVEGLYLLSALSGYGMMSSSACGELLAAHLTGAALPAYAPAFAPRRFEDPAYRAAVEQWAETGQL
jgi:glycine/D-amino acid oxidase-like deaminating enzyme